VLLAAIKSYGSSWRKVSKQLPGRTEAMCRNRYQRIMAPHRTKTISKKPPNRCSRCGEVKRGHICGGWPKVGSQEPPDLPLPGRVRDAQMFDTLCVPDEITRPVLEEEQPPASPEPLAEQEAPRPETPVEEDAATISDAGSVTAIADGLFGSRFLHEADLLRYLVTARPDVSVPIAAKQNTMELGDAMYDGIFPVDVLSIQRPSSPPPALPSDGLEWSPPFCRQASGSLRVSAGMSPEDWLDIM